MTNQELFEKAVAYATMKHGIYVEGTKEHEYELVGTQEKTCSQPGRLIYQCTVCGYEHTDVDWDTSDESLHKYSITKSYTAPTCCKSGELLEVCEYCGQGRKTKLPPTAEQIETYEKETCGQIGHISITCSGCGWYRCIKNIPATGMHVWETKSLDEADAEARAVNWSSYDYREYLSEMDKYWVKACSVCKRVDHTTITPKENAVASKLIGDFASVIEPCYLPYVVRIQYL